MKGSVRDEPLIYSLVKVCVVKNYCVVKIESVVIFHEASYYEE